MDPGNHRVFYKMGRSYPFEKATRAVVTNFIWEHIITGFGTPKRLISDNGTPFINRDMKNLTEAYCIKAWKVHTILSTRKW